MSLFYLMLVAIIQGLTEFLPISSSGHLVLLPQVTGVADQGLVIDVAVHVGTLGAVILFFRQDVALILAGTGRLLRGRIDTHGAFLALCLAIATVPVVVCGIALQLSGLAETLRSVAVIGWTMLIFGIVLYLADQRGPILRRAAQWTLKDAALMGLAQCIALIPGTSRAGICITAGRALGYDRESAARLAMLMSVPTIAASGVAQGADAARLANWQVVTEAGIAAALAFVCALGALALMMRLLRSVSFTPYVIYRVILGVGLLIWAYT